MYGWPEILLEELLVMRTVVSLPAQSGVASLQLCYLFLALSHWIYSFLIKCWHVVTQNVLTAFSRMENMCLLSVAGLLMRNCKEQVAGSWDFIGVTPVWMWRWVHLLRVWCQNVKNWITWVLRSVVRGWADWKCAWILEVSRWELRRHGVKRLTWSIATCWNAECMNVNTTF